MPYRKGKYWMARVQKDGRIRTKQCATKAEAQAVEVAMRQEDWTTPDKRTVTVLEWANEYLDFAKERFSDKTYNEKRKACAGLLRELGHSSGSDVCSLSLPAVMSALRARSRRDGGNAANKDRKNLSAGWEWGVKFLGLPESNPFRRIPRFAEKRSPRYVPSEADFWKVFERANEQDRIMLLTMLHTAGRKEEVLSLRWPDVDLGARTVRLSTRKRADGSLEHDILPMTQELHDALAGHKGRANSIYVFAKENGQRYTHRVHLMKYLCGLAGVRAFGFHAIRHLSASILDKAGLELSTIQAILRHKSATTTARYLHSLRGTKVALDEVFGGKVVEMKKAPVAGTTGA